MSAIYTRGRAKIEANLTPMIDVTFLLIVFFVLVSQIVDVERVEMNLPAPAEPVSVKPGEEHRAVINVLPGPGGAPRAYRLGTRTYPTDDAGLRAMTDQLAELYRVNPQLNVRLRADRATHYAHVQRAMQAVADAASSVNASITPRINLAIEREEAGGDG